MKNDQQVFTCRDVLCGCIEAVESPRRVVAATAAVIIAIAVVVASATRAAAFREE